MAVTQRKDGVWACYYPKKDESGNVVKKNGRPQYTWEYFGRGAAGEKAARARNEELGLQRTRPPKAQIGGPTLYELAASYILLKQFADNPKKHLKIRLEANLLPHFGNMPALKISDHDIDTYIKKRRTAGRKYSTIRRELTDLKAILNFAASRKPPLIPFNPVRDYELPKPDDEIIEPPTEAEIERIIKNASPMLKRAIVMSYFLGLRPGTVELLSLTWAHVRWSAGVISVRSALKGGPIRRDVPIQKGFFPILQSWRKNDRRDHPGCDDLPIVHYRGKRVTTLKNSWKKALASAKIRRRLRPYDLRHYFVTRCLEEGADLKALSEVVGSRPETIWRSYQHVSRGLRQRVVESVNPGKLADLTSNTSSKPAKKKGAKRRPTS